MSLRPAVLFKGHGLSWFTEIPRPLLALPGCSKLSGVDLRYDGVIRPSPGRTLSDLSHKEMFPETPIMSVYPFSLASKNGGVYHGVACSDGCHLVIYKKAPSEPQVIQNVGTLGTTWRFAVAKFGLFAVNGVDDPFQIIVDNSGTFSKISFGLQDLDGELALTSSTSGGSLRQGTYKVRIRGWDEDTNTFTSISPQISTNTGGTDAKNRLVVGLTDVIVDPRVTKVQIFRTQAAEDVFYKDVEVDVPSYPVWSEEAEYLTGDIVRSASNKYFDLYKCKSDHTNQPLSETTYWTHTGTYAYLTQSDLDLVSDLNRVLMPNDYVRQSPINGSNVWGYEDLLLLSGVTDSSYSGIYRSNTHPARIFYSSTYVDDPESFDYSRSITLGPVSDPIIGGAQVGDYMLIFTQRCIYRLQRLGSKLVLSDQIQGRGALSQDAMVSTPRGVVFQAPDGLFITAGDTPFEIGKAIKTWVNGKSLVLAWDPIHQFLYAQDKEGTECAVCWINSASQVRWALLEDHPGKWIFCSAGLEEEEDDTLRTYTLLDTEQGLPVKPIWYEGEGTSHGVRADLTISEGTGCQYNSVAKTFILDETTYGPVANSIGTVVRVITGVSAGETRLIVGQSGTVLTHDGAALTLSPGDKLMTGIIPFAVRFPPIIGSDPFQRKLTQSITLMGRTLATDAEMPIRVITYSDMIQNTSADSGGTITLKNHGRNTSAQNSCVMRADGQMIEVELQAMEQISGGWELYFAQAMATMLNTRQTRG